MRKRTLMSMAAVVSLSLLLFAGCGEEQKAENIPTEPPVATETVAPTAEPTATTAPTATEAPAPTATEEPAPTATETPAPTATEAPTPTATEAPAPTATEAPTPTATETPAPAPTATEAPTPTVTATPVPTATATPEPTAAATQAPTATATPVPTATSTPTPTPAPTATPTPTPTNTPIPTPTEAPIVQKVGSADDATYEKAVSAFESIVKKMRADGLVKSSDVCVTLDNTDIKVDITFDNSDIDLTLCKDNSTNSYTLTFDYNFIWLEGFGPTVNGKDPALYNKELLLATLSMVSDEPKSLFDRIDLDCFSPAALSETEWTEIGDCFIKSGGVVIDEYIAYNITKEVKDSRNSTYVLTGTNSSGATIECVIEYDSSLVAYEVRQNDDWGFSVNGEPIPSGTVTYMHPVDESKWGPYCYPVIKTGCTSYENYKQNFINKYIAAGAANPTVSDYSSHTVNGYTYYWCEGFFMTETEIGDPDIVYVQIGENEYIELYNVMFEERFEDFVNGSFYIKEVTVK